MKKSLRAVRRRIHLIRFVHGLLIGLLVGAIGCLGLAAASFLWPIEGLWRYLVALAAGCPLLGGLIGLLLPVTLPGAARRADACGLKERALTALTLTGEDTPMARLQRADAQAKLAALPVRKAMPVRPRRSTWLPALAMLAVTAILLVIPNPQNDVIREREAMRQSLKAQAEAIEEAAEKVAEEGLTEEEQQELRRITSEMADELRTADDKREALEKLDEKQKEMERLQRKVAERTSENLSKALGEQNSLESLAKALEGGSAAEMQEALDKIAEMMETTEGQESLAEELAKAAESLSEGEAKQALQAAAAAAAAGNTGMAMQALASASGMMSGMASAGNTGANISALMQMARSGVAQSGNSGSGSGSGGSGMGAGAGTGSGASRAGFGTTNRDIGYTPGFSESSQQASMAGNMERIGEYERIYDPNRLGGDAAPSLVQGQENEGDSQQLELGPGLGNFAGSVPYNEVIGEYQDAAAQAMRRTAFPAALQDWVDRYFNSLID